jgi:hypothetical protein
MGVFLRTGAVLPRPAKPFGAPSFASVAGASVTPLRSGAEAAPPLSLRSLRLAPSERRLVMQ